MSFNYYYFVDEQACLVNYTEFAIEDLEEIKRKLMFHTVAEHFYISCWQNEFCKSTFGSKGLAEWFCFVKFIEIRSYEAILPDDTLIIMYYIDRVVDKFDQDITEYGISYTHIPIIEINSPKLFQKGYWTYHDPKNTLKTKKEEIIVPDCFLDWPFILTLYCLENKNVFALF